MKTVQRLTSRKTYITLVGAAFVVGLLVRVPGVFWGDNFPFGWHIHHPDEWTHLVHAEILINPNAPPRWVPTPYPPGMASMVAGPVIIARMLQGQPGALPVPQTIVRIGRSISVLFGAATILIVVLLSNSIFSDRRVSIFSAWILALGGLHVAQSHFFLADVASLFWLLAGIYLLRLDLTQKDHHTIEYLRWSAFCFGLAFGTKLVVAGIPSLAIIAVYQAPRVKRLIHVAVFFTAGTFLVTLGTYSPYDFIKTILYGSSDPYHFDRLTGTLLYLLELPRVISFPVAIVALFSVGALLFRFMSSRRLRKDMALWLTVFLPLIVQFFIVVTIKDHFPRHILSFIPWLAMAAGWGIVRMTDSFRKRNVPSVLFLVPFFAYLSLFVIDLERMYLHDPRNDAALWLKNNVQPGTMVNWQRHDDVRYFNIVGYPVVQNPQVLVIEMQDANQILSGVDFKNSYPRDYRFVHDADTQERVDAIQALFRGKSDYHEVARFKEGYFMPEYIITDSILGNRSTNYISEIVIFEKNKEKTGEE